MAAANTGPATAGGLPVEPALAVEANLAERYSLFRYWPRAQVCDRPELLWTLTDLPLAFFNNVTRARLEDGEADAAVEESIARCRSRRVPMNWWTGPATQPPGLGAVLEAHGFRRAGAEPGMWADLAAPAPPPATCSALAVHRVTGGEALDQWCSVLAACFGFPGAALEPFIESTRAALDASDRLRCYAGRLGNEAVATSFVVLGAGVAGVHGVGVAPRWRRQGIGTAMTMAALAAPRALGYRLASLRASPLGQGVYRRLGFRECGQVARYIWEPG